MSGRDEVLTVKFSKSDLEKLLDQTLIYECSCPGQVAGLLAQVRNLHRYQLECSAKDETVEQTHARFLQALDRCHTELEMALADVLENEGWNLSSLAMPDGLRRKIVTGH